MCMSCIRGEAQNLVGQEERILVCLFLLALVTRESKLLHCG